MNIDERLDALAQTVEILTLDVKELQDSVREMKDSTNEFRKSIGTFRDSVERYITEQHETNTRMVESIAGLVRVAQTHENRLIRLEGTAD